MQQPETPLELAITSYTSQLHIPIEDQSSIRQTAEDLFVSRTTLSNRLRGVTQSRLELLPTAKPSHMMKKHPWSSTYAVPPSLAIHRRHTWCTKWLMRYARIDFSWHHPSPFLALRLVIHGSTNSASVTHRLPASGPGSSIRPGSMQQLRRT